MYELIFLLKVHFVKVSCTKHVVMKLELKE